MKVLIIEPNASHAASLASISRALGQQPIFCSDPNEAIRTAGETSPGLILLGLSFQRLDIYDYARLLREQDDLADVKIVAVSGEVEDPHRARVAGINIELLRPFSRGILPVLRESLHMEAH